MPPNWAAAKMTEVGIERFRTGHDQEDCTKRIKSDDAVMEKKTHSVPGIESQQNRQVLSHTPNARDRDGGEPKKHDRTEEGRNTGRPARLHQNKMTRMKTVSGTT